MKRDFLLDVVSLGIESLGEHLVQIGLAAAAAGVLAVFRLALGLVQG